MVPTAKAQFGKNLQILLKSSEDIPYFVYVVVGRGKILNSDFISLEKKQKEHTIDLATTFEMMPHAVIFVHFIVDNKLRFEEHKIYFQHEFQNKLHVKTSVEAKPGQEISLEIETAQDSFVGLLGVDQSVLLLRAGNDLDADTIVDKLCHCYNEVNKTARDCTARYPGELSGLIMLGNIWYPSRQPAGPVIFGSAPICRFGFGAPAALNAQFAPATNLFGGAATGQFNFAAMPPIPATEIRKQFCENWIFDDIDCTNKNVTILQKKLPDTITSWVLTDFAVNQESGFAITKQPTLVKTFRPFFLGTNLSYSIKRGEIVSIPVLLFNYMDQDLNAEVTFDNSDDEFEFTEADDKNQSKCVKQLKVAANYAANINFKIRPKVIGQITLKITAVSALAGDAIHKKLKVEAEGITIYKNKDYYLNSESETHKNAVELDIPKDIVPDSEFIEVSLMGNILGSTIANIDKLVRLPFGCGEQNMINFVPNILVLRYLESINALTSSIESKAKRFLEIGYQRELTYKHFDGSYSAFGKADKSGSTWLTAYVMRSFHQVKQYIDISSKILEDGLNFLAMTQAVNGSFKEVGCVIDFAHMNELGLTAFVLLAFLENNETIDKHKNVIDRGFEYLEKNVRDSVDLYALSIALYTLQQRKSLIVHEFPTKLETFARIDGGHKWWTTKETAVDTDIKSKQLWRPVQSHIVEITGYILMTLLDLNVAVMPITKWLISQRNSNGGFASTQETVVGLWALIKFAEKSGAARPDMNVEISTDIDSSTARKIHVNNDNALVVQKVELPKQTRKIKFNSKGTGTAIFQISYHYNILKKLQKPSFKLNSKVKLAARKLFLEISTEFVVAKLGEQKSNMVIMEIAMPSGFTVLKENFKKIKEAEKIKRIECTNEDTLVMVYFESLEISQPKIVFIEAQPIHEVNGQKPAAITIYDYYDNEKRAIDFYQI